MRQAIWFCFSQLLCKGRSEATGETTIALLLLCLARMEMPWGRESGWDQVHANHEDARAEEARVWGRCDCEQKCLALVIWYLIWWYFMSEFGALVLVEVIQTEMHRNLSGYFSWYSQMSAFRSFVSLSSCKSWSCVLRKNIRASEESCWLLTGTCKLGGHRHGLKLKIGSKWTQNWTQNQSQSASEASQGRLCHDLGVSWECLGTPGQGLQRPKCDVVTIWVIFGGQKVRVCRAKPTKKVFKIAIKT